MKKIYFLINFILIISNFTPLSFAKTYHGETTLSDDKLTDITIMGSSKLHKLTLESMNITGPLYFKKLTVNNDAIVVGPVEGKYGKFKNLAVTGPLTLHRTKIDSLNLIGPLTGISIKIKGLATIIGPIVANDSEFNNIILTSNISELNNSSANDIHIKNSKDNSYWHEKAPQLKLTGKSIIRGDIIFESKNGKVIVSDKSKIKGKVKGAEVIKLNK